MFRYGKEINPGEYLIDIKHTHAILASLMGLTRETTTTELGRLKRKGIIYYNAKDLIIYEEALKKVIGDNSLYDIDLS